MVMFSPKKSFPEAKFADSVIHKLTIKAAYPYEGTLILPDGRNFNIKLEADSSVTVI